MQRINSIILIVSLLCVSCNQATKVEPKEAEKSISSPTTSTGIFSDASASKDVQKASLTNDDSHTVKVIQVLPTEKYVYMEVEEGQETFWVAAGKQEVEVGEEYFFKEGLLKTNFHSKEYDRVFDKVYLVSRLIPLTKNTAPARQSGSASTKKTSPKKSKAHAESVSIKDIVENPDQYKDKSVIVSGECTKINANIMSRNWIHLKDGSKDDFDFVLTSDLAVPEGHFVSMRGVIRVDKDFGAGYRYAIIMEEAEMVK